jgi:hypothetical protein
MEPLYPIKIQISDSEIINEKEIVACVIVYGKEV